MFVSSFMALFPVANPIGSGFIINGLLSGLADDQRKSIIKRIVVNYLLIGIASLAIGHLVLSLFSLSLSVVQLGGGLLICKTALQWLSSSDNSTDSKSNNEVNSVNLNTISSQVFYPMTFPISMGPGSISVIFTLMASASIKGDWFKSIINYLIIAAVIFVMCIILYIFLTQGQKIMKRLGSAGNMVINKMVAFFTFCVGIQIVLSGIDKIFNLNLGL